MVASLLKPFKTGFRVHPLKCKPMLSVQHDNLSYASIYMVPLCSDRLPLRPRAANRQEVCLHYFLLCPQLGPLPSCCGC